MKTNSSLIIAPQWIGDAVMTEPLTRRLHARGEQLTVAALPWVAPVYRAMPQVARVIELPFRHGALQFKERHALARQLKGQFDCAYVLPGSLKSALIPFLARIPKRVGYLGEARVGLLTHRLKNPSKQKRPPMVAYYSALSGEADLEQDRPQLGLSREQVDATLSALSLQRASYYVFVPGAEYGPAKRWPAQHFIDLARSLKFPVLLLGAKKDHELCEQIASQAPNCQNFAGKTSLDQAFAVIAATKSVVTNDSGLMHVAASLDVPQVAIFGSSSPEHTPPLSAQASVLWLKSDASYQPPLDCAPCFERECKFGHLRCLNDIASARVLGLLSI